jgi:signal transduction histidine kinase
VGKVKAAEKDMIQQAFDSAENMVDLIADLLNVSRMQSGKFVIENKPTQLADMVAAEVHRLSETASNKKINLSFQKPASFPILSLDENKMRQVIMNFLDNALYYTPEGGAVSVALEAAKDSISYTVTDNGMGVPKAVQHHLFSKFYRADNARKMRPDGTGLGLFMAKKVIVAQGGAIIFKSMEGKGSTFGFSFPRSKLEVKH